MTTVKQFYKTGSKLFISDDLLASEKLNNTFNLLYGGYLLLTEDTINLQNSTQVILSANIQKYNAILKAIGALQDVDPLAQGARRVTVSNSGESSDTTMQNETGAQNSNYSATGSMSSNSTQADTILENSSNDTSNIATGSKIESETNTASSKTDSIGKDTTLRNDATISKEDSTSTGADTNTSKAISDTGKRTFNKGEMTILDNVTTSNTGETKHTGTDSKLGDIKTTINDTKDSTLGVTASNTGENKRTGTDSISSTIKATNSTTGENSSTANSVADSTNTNIGKTDSTKAINSNSVKKDNSLTSTQETFYNNLEEALRNYMSLGTVNLINEICSDVFKVICIPLMILDDDYYNY